MGNDNLLEKIGSPLWEWGSESAGNQGTEEEALHSIASEPSQVEFASLPAKSFFDTPPATFHSILTFDPKVESSCKTEGIPHPAMSLAQNAERQREGLPALELELKKLQGESPETQEEFLKLVEEMAESFLKQTTTSFPDPKDAELIQEKFHGLAAETYGMLARVAAGSVDPEIQKRAALYEGYKKLALGNIDDAKSEFEKIQDEVPEAEERLEFLERSRLRQINLAALETWSAFVEEENIVKNEQMKSILGNFMLAAEQLYRGNGEGLDSDLAIHVYTERKLIAEARSLILSGDCDTVKEALYHLAQAGAPAVKARAWKLYEACGPDPRKIPDRSSLIPRLIEYTAQQNPDSSLAGTLYQEAERLESEYLEYGVGQAALGVISILHETSDDPLIRKDTALYLRQSNLEKGFGDYVWAFLKSTSVEDLGLGVTLMAGAATVGGAAELATLDKFRQAGQVGWKGIAMARGAGAVAEGTTLWALNTGHEALVHDTARFTPEYLIKSYGATVIMIGSLKTTGTLGQTYAPQVARTFGLVSEGGAKLSTGGRVLSWSLGHGAGMGGMVASTQLNEALHLQETPEGGFEESLVHDMAGYIRFALAHKLVDRFSQGALSKFSLPQHQAIALRQAQMRVEAKLPELGYEIKGRTPTGDPIFENAVPLYDQLVFATLTRPGFSSEKLTELVTDGQLKEARAYAQGFGLRLAFDGEQPTALQEIPFQPRPRHPALHPLLRPMWMLMGMGGPGASGGKGKPEQQKAKTTYAPTPEKLRADVGYILENYMGADPAKISAGHSFLYTRFKTPDGDEVSGSQILGSVARFERPGMNKEAAVKALGGQARLVEILKEKYLGITPLVSTWDQSPERLKETVCYILKNALGDDPEKISTGPSFFRVRFQTPDGGEVSGRQILFAVAGFEKPGMSKNVAIKALGGDLNVIKILKEKYLDLTPLARTWDQSPERLKETLVYILGNSLEGDPSKITTGSSFLHSHFKTPDGGEVSGHQILWAVAGCERPGMSKNAAIKALGGPLDVIKILKDKYLAISVWDESPERLRETITYILGNSLGGDHGKITTHSFSQCRFKTPDGSEVSGYQILWAVAGYERPGMSRGAAVKALGGLGRVVEILKEKYLVVSDWDGSPERLRETIIYILRNYLGGDPNKVSTSASFTQTRFKIPDGGEVSGQQILWAVAGCERPGMSKKAAVKTLGGLGRVVEILKEKYFNLTSLVRTWDQSPERLKETISYILENSLGGDLEKISTGVSFSRARFKTPDGGEVSGQQILWAVAGCERPGMSKDAAVKTLGGLLNVVKILKEKYLDLTSLVRTWDQSPDRLKETIAYILGNSLEGDPSRITTSTSFIRGRFKTPDGGEVSGHQILWAVAGCERPGMSRGAAIKALGSYLNVVKILKEKYLGITPLVSTWDQSPERLKETVCYILENSLEGDPKKISTSESFIETRHKTPDGGKVSGYQILGAVAGFEKPGMSKTTAIEALGGPASVVKILKEKYLGILDLRNASPAFIESFVKEYGLQEILDLFPDSPAEAIRALSFLKSEQLKYQDIREIVKGYLGLKAGKGAGGGPGIGPIDSWELQRRYLKALIQAMDRGDQLDLSEENFRSQLHLLVNISRKSHEEDAPRFFQTLDAKLEECSHPFAKRLLQETIKYFQERFNFEVKGMTTTPYGYQREGIHFLAHHPRAILADEAGLGKSYQAIGAVETLGLKRVLWITTAANKKTLEEEILEHSKTTPEQIGVVLSGNPRGRRQQIEALNGQKYLITNYETLVALKRSDPECYDKLTQGLDAVIVDEAQLTDNPKALRTQAVHDIAAPRRWLLSASPYQNKPENLWTLLNWIEPEKYPDKKAFLEMYAQNTQGLIFLRNEISEVLLRRSKQNTMGHFKPESVQSFAEQLADGIPRVPQLSRVSPEVSGRYELLPEQADLIARMTADFEGWVAEFNQNLPNGAEPIPQEGINPLMKFTYIQKTIYQPEYFGIKGENPVYRAVDESVAERLARGEKIILWGWNTPLIETLEKRYRDLGVRRIDGTVVGEARERARHDFQEDAKVRILVANYSSGGVGLTLSAAHSAIFVQLPHYYPMLYQAEGRHQRLIGPKNARHAKERVEVEWMIPVLPEGFVEEISDPRLREILSHGTLVEQTRERLAGGELLYNLLMEGMGDPKEIEEHFKKGLFEGMGLNRKGKLDYTSHLKGESKEWAEVAQALLPLWRKLKGDAAGEECVLRLMVQLKNNSELALRLGAQLGRLKEVPKEDVEFVIRIFEIRNKYIRQKILQKVPDLMARVYAQGKTLEEVSQGLKLGKLSPVSFVAQLYQEAGAGGEVILGLTRELSQMRDTPLKRYLEEHFFMGIFGIMGQAHAEKFLLDKCVLLNEAPLNNRIHMLYRLGLLSDFRPDLVEGMGKTSFDDWKSLASSLEAATYEALGDFAGRSAESVQEMVASNPNWRGNADPLLALLVAYRNANEMQLLEQMREIQSNLFAGQYTEWRYGENDRSQGASIEFMRDQAAFWEGYAKDDPSKLATVSVSTQKIKQTLFQQYQAVMEEFAQEVSAAEGPWVAHELEQFRRASQTQQQDILERYQGELSVLGAVLGRNEPSPETGPLLGKYQLSGEDNLEARISLQEKVDELRNLTAWMRMDLGFRAIQNDFSMGADSLARQIDQKTKHYRRRKFDKAAEHLEALQESVKKWDSRAYTFKDVTIEDTDDPAILTRMGALHPEMINCFNPNGNPTFNQHVVAALGSKNMKMVVVREQGKIVAAAMVKVKELEDGRPVMFLENGLYRKGYDFREEMLAHLQNKAEKIKPKPVVMEQIRGGIKEDDPFVHGTGAYTESEYVEPVFGLRDASNVRHRGRAFGKPLGKVIPKPLDSEPFEVHGDMMLMGIGTSNKSWEEYVGSLLERGVKVLVDVRANPFSRFRPHFNRKQMEAKLKEAGIQYVWLGETLGNPKDTKGMRTLSGFQKYMKTAKYQEGMKVLQEIIRSSKGHIALTCSEGRECDCHRQFILDDLQKP